MSNTGNSIKDDPLREIAGGSITATYQSLGGVFTRDVFRMTVTNWTNGDVYLSTDGVTDMKKFAAFSGRCTDNKTNDMFIKAGTQWYVRYDMLPGAPTGWFALEAEYV